MSGDTNIAELEVNPFAQVVRGETGEIWVLLPNRNLRIEGLNPVLLQGIFELVNAKTELASIRKALEGRFADSEIDRTLSALGNALWRQTPAGETPVQGSMQQLMVMGNGLLFRLLCRKLRQSGIVPCRFVEIRSFASCLDPAFTVAEQARILWRPRVPDLQCPKRPEDYDLEHRVAVGVEQLATLCANAGLVICAFEAVAVRGLLDLEEACERIDLPCLHVTPLGPGEVLVGPTYVPGVSASLSEWLRPRMAPYCNESSVFPLIRIPSFSSDPGSTTLLNAIAGEVLSEARVVLAPRPLTLRAATLVYLSARGDRIVEPAFPKRPRKEADRDPVGSRGLRESAVSVLAGTIGASWISPVENRRSQRPDAYRTVGILGGGTAGYLTALALRACRPELDVTLVESSAVPVIGVGEATTPDLVRFLHGRRFLGLDVIDFYRRVLPTWKLGIKFFWGLPGDYFFTFPFQRGRLLESYVYKGHLNHQSLGALLMSGNRAPLFSRADGTCESYLSKIRWAYHLENRRFVRYLHEEAVRAGVRHLDCVVRDAALSADGQEIDCLLTEDGRRLAFDLYVDCSGFRSFLMEGKLGSSFLSYQSTLMTDCAIAAGVPHDGVVKPYTLAEAMDHGWCWNIPFEDEDHRGYVFSSSFASVDQAMEEMRRKNPGMHDPFVVPFRSGRHEHFWKGNVVAIGNAYAFVEPLESTAIHMIVLELDLLTTHFPQSRRDTAVKDALNRRINQRWDTLRWFLGLHYKFNRKFSTPFWRAANEIIDISGAEERLQLFRERAPLSYQRPFFYPVVPPEFFSDDHSFDTILLGQQVKARLVDPEEKDEWVAQAGALERFASRALGQREALELLRQRPEMLAEFVTDSESWVHRWLPT